MDIGGVADRGTVRFEQAEFWGGNEKAPETVRAMRMAEKPVEPPAPPPPARAAKARSRYRSEATVTVYAEKKKNRSIMRIAKFLNISDSLYDGRDRGRWYDLPLRRGQVPYQLTNEVSAANLEGRTLRSVPRVFSGISRPRENGYLMK